MLTEGRDVAEGTADNDTFMGLVGQNQDGALSNAFATGDYVDGGNGRDKIEASVMEDQETEGGADSAINARTVNVEEVYLEALDLNGAGGIAAQDTVVVDAGRMDSVEQFWSDNSSADLIIDDVRLGSKLSVTKDITFGLRDVDVDSGLEAWFDTNSLTNEGSFAVNSSLVIRAADVGTETPEAPLSNVQLEIGFTIGGEDVNIVVQSENGTYAGLRNAIEQALADAGQSGLNVALSNPYSEVVFAGNTTQLPFTAQEIVITDPNGNEFENVDFQPSNINPVPGGFLLAGNAAPQDPSTSTTLIESNLVLDNAGRGSTAGDVVIGGMSDSGKVVEKLNLIVDRSSKISELHTASGRNDLADVAFQQIEVTSGEAQGNLSIENVFNVYNFDATAFQGATLSVEGDAKQATSHVYNTAGSNDSITVNYDGDMASEFASFSLGVNTSGGNDTVVLVSDFETPRDLSNQQDLDNIVVNTGSGDDVVSTFGAGRVAIATGSGNDTVYSDNSGSTFVAAGYNLGLTEAEFGELANANGQVHAHWTLFGQDNNILDMRGYDVTNSGNAQNANEPGAIAPMLLEGAQVRITLSDAFGVMETATTDADAGVNGLEALADIQTVNGFATHAEINAAIIEAINNSSVLNKLLQAEAGPDNTLIIRSLIDGQFDSEDLQLDILAGDAENADAPNYIGSSAVSDLANALKADSDAANLTPAQVQAALDNGANTAQSWIDGANATFGIATAGASGTPATPEQQTIDFTNLSDVDLGGDGDITIGGVAVALVAGDTAADVATKVQAAIDGQVLNGGAAAVSAAVNGTEVVITFDVADGDAGLTTLVNTTATFVDGDFADVTVAETQAFNAAVAGADEITGTVSQAESDNVIDLGSGDDVLVLSTGANSNETIVFEDVIGENTIVNFDDAAYGTGSGDQISLASYLTARTSSSGSEQSIDAASADAGVSSVGEAGLEAAMENDVNSIIEFTGVAFTADDNWAGLTADNLEAALSGGNAYAGINSDITANFAENANLFGDSHKSVVFVENDANNGEYKVFEFSVAEESLQVSLVGVVDFGEGITFNDGNFAEAV